MHEQRRAPEASRSPRLVATASGFACLRPAGRGKSSSTEIDSNHHLQKGQHVSAPRIRYETRLMDTDSIALMKTCNPLFVGLIYLNLLIPCKRVPSLHTRQLYCSRLSWRCTPSSARNGAPILTRTSASRTLILPRPIAFPPLHRAARPMRPSPVRKRPLPPAKPSAPPRPQSFPSRGCAMFLSILRQGATYCANTAARSRRPSRHDARKSHARRRTTVWHPETFLTPTLLYIYRLTYLTHTTCIHSFDSKIMCIILLLGDATGNTRGKYTRTKTKIIRSRGSDEADISRRTGVSRDCAGRVWPST